ncbi:hypothetical protein [Psychrobacter sp. FME5]|uniref:hypothetical protein n=1 Tax=Psychrobacter sp. FME5 TaxID=2487706 RepID=UPI001787C0CB|nr:hypothetical protein [Psychrobacter sp. FME5]MBE0445805.1 hypothetical protein [Psychrobacter sp. FME5]
METLFRVLGVLIVSFNSLSLVESSTRGNQRINKFFSDIQDSYNKLNRNLEILSFVEGIKALSKFYGWASLIFFTLFFISNKFISKDLGYVFFLVFAFVFMSWFSIKWFIDHKNTIFKGSRNVILMILSPILLGGFDLLIGENLTSDFFIAIADSLSSIFPSFIILLENTGMNFNSPVISSITLSLILLLVFLIYYLIMWIFTLPIFLIALITAILPIQFARTTSWCNKENPYFWFATITSIVIGVWLII